MRVYRLHIVSIYGVSKYTAIKVVYGYYNRNVTVRAINDYIRAHFYGNSIFYLY